MPSKLDARVRPAVVEVTHPRELLSSLRTGAVLSVWKGAVQDSALLAAITSDDWPLRMLELQPPTKAWRLNLGRNVKYGPMNDTEAVLRAACANPPSGNAHAILSIRDYSDDQSAEGGLEWWNSLVQLVSNAMTRAFVAAMIDLLRRAEHERLRLLVEEVSMVISRDADSPLATLTPTLHADEHYGPCGAAVISICADSGTSNGTTFAPTLSMEEVWHLRPIKLEDLSTIVREDDLYRARSGDLALYSGMKDEQGIVHRANGIPHISSDFPGSGARLAVLLRRDSEGGLP